MWAEKQARTCKQRSRGAGGQKSVMVTQVMGPSGRTALIAPVCTIQCSITCYLSQILVIFIIFYLGTMYKIALSLAQK